MSFNLESLIEAIKLELSKYKVQEIKNVCKALNQSARIYTTGKTKQQLINEIANRLEFLLKTKKNKAGAKYKGKGLGDDLLNAAMPYVSKGLSTATNALKTSMHDVMGKIPGMDFFEHAMHL